MKQQLTLGLVAIGALIAGCAKQMPSAPSVDNVASALQGTWNYVATDTTDLSDYGITYAFNGTQWTYTLGDAGSKVYDITTDGEAFRATLSKSTVSTEDAIGSTVDGTYHISGDTLVMTSGGHNAILIHE